MDNELFISITRYLKDEIVFRDKNSKENLKQ